MTDWIMIIITTVYVIATFLICYFNAKAAKAATEQTEELIYQRLQSDRPYISICFDIIRSGLMCFIIENHGTKPAFNLSICLNDEFIENIDDNGSKEHLKKLKTSKIFVGVNQKLHIFIDSQLQFKKIAQQKAIFNLTYNDKFSEEIVIDIDQYSFMLIYKSPTEDISQHLKKIKEDSSKFQKDLIRHLNIKSPNVINVVSHSASKYDTLKFKIYKTVCLEGSATLKEIVEKNDIDLMKAHNILVELMCFDNLVWTTDNVDIDKFSEEEVWHKK